jgi:hypothetical protein
MPIFVVVLILIVIGFLLWAMNTYVPMQPGIKKIINWLVIILAIIWVLKVIGLWAYLLSVNV